MKKIFPILILLLLFLACEEVQEPDMDDCPEQLVCTEQLVALTYTPRNGETVVQYDSYYTQNLDNGEIYTFDSYHSPNDEYSFYVIISDSQFEEIKQGGTNIRFFGIQNNEIISTEDFKVGHDCCHVIPLEGPFTNF